MNSRHSTRKWLKYVTFNDLIVVFGYVKKFFILVWLSKMWLRVICLPCPFTHNKSLQNCSTLGRCLQNFNKNPSQKINITLNRWPNNINYTTCIWLLTFFLLYFQHDNKRKKVKNRWKMCILAMSSCLKICKCLEC